MRRFEVNRLQEPGRVFTVTAGKLPSWPWTCSCRTFGCIHVSAAKDSLRTAVSRAGLDHPTGSKVRLDGKEYRVRRVAERSVG